MVNSKVNNMERPLKMWEFITGLFGILVVVAGLIYSRGTMDARNQIDIDTLKAQMTEIKTDYKQQNAELSQKVDKADAKLNDILIILQNKQDRK